MISVTGMADSSTCDDVTLAVTCSSSATCSRRSPLLAINRFSTCTNLEFRVWDFGYRVYFLTQVAFACAWSNKVLLDLH